MLPYVRFVRDHVLLRFDARAYRVPGDQVDINTQGLSFFRMTYVSVVDLLSIFFSSIFVCLLAPRLPAFP